MFSVEELRALAGRACRAVGLPDGSVELLRLGENAIFRLGSAPVVVRIARDAERLPVVGRELCVARWLRGALVPAVEPVDGVEQPIVVDGYPVSFWRAVTSQEPKPDLVDLARLLKGFHRAGEPPCELPRFDPLYRVEERLSAATAVLQADREFLLARHAELAKRYSELEFVLPEGPIHGDAHVGNLLRTQEGVLLLDFEVVAYGPREWDLTPTAVTSERFGLPDHKYRSFCEVYGFDLRGWTDYKVLRDIRELTMTTWLMQNVGEDPRIAEEFALRVRSLREGDRDVVWHPF